MQRQLGRRLRQLRKAAGRSDVDVEASGVASRVKLWRIETAKVQAKVGDVRGLCWLYGVDEPTADMLTEWTRNGKQPGWWEDFDEPLSTRDGLFAGLAAIAQHLMIFESRQVPDLLQTPDYTRAQFLAVKPNATESAVTDHLKHRQERQSALTNELSPMRLTVILDEGCLTRPIGGKHTQQEQIGLLKDLADRVHIEIRYLPWRAGAHPAMHIGGFTIMEFADTQDPEVVYIDSHTGARYIELSSEVTEYRRIFASTYALGVPISEYRC